MKKILPSILIIGIVTSLSVGLTKAFFSDKETSTNNTLTTGKLDLKIDNESYYNGALSEATTWQSQDLPGKLFFNFPDIKPNDWGEDTISLHVDNNDAWACAQFTLTKNDDNTCTTPELQADPTCNEPNQNLADGELGSEVNMVFWADDGDNVWETGEPAITSGNAQTVFASKFAIADATHNIWGTPGPLKGLADYYIGKGWCFGSLTPAQITQDNLGKTGSNGPLVRGTGFTCNGNTVNNASQSDLLNADITFTAMQYRNNPNFSCFGTPTPTATATPTNSPTPTATATPTPTQIACTETFAASASSNNQGKRKDGTNILADRINPAAMFGAPQTAGAASDSSFPAGSFFSLGFTNGNIVLGFTNPFLNKAGADLQIYEVTGGVYPDEKVKVEVADSASGPWTVVATEVTRDGTVDIDPIPSAKFVRLTDVSNINLFANDADGYDVDAVKALCGQ